MRDFTDTCREFKDIKMRKSHIIGKIIFSLTPSQGLKGDGPGIKFSLFSKLYWNFKEII